jgi:microsomal dipeptidase-like Zn-dependent dipeptidase
MAKTPHRRRRWPWLAGALALVLVTAFFSLAPGIVERSLNRIEGSGEWNVSSRARALHQRLFIADLHADTLLWKRDPLHRAGRGHVDFPRLEEGNVALQLFSSVTKTPSGQNYDANSADSDNITTLAMAQLQPPRTWDSLLQRSLWHAEKLRRAAAADHDVAIILTSADIDRLIARRRVGGGTPIGAMLSIEGLQNLEGQLSNVDVLFDAGYRMAGLAHFFDNEVAGSMHGTRKGGLTPLGRKVMQRMEEKGMIIDIAHASHKAVADVLAVATKPVVTSHGGVKATCDTNRNLTDDEIRGIAATGGVVGIGFWDAAVCAATPQATARAMRHVRDLVGIEYVALGSDWDGATTVGVDAAGLAAVTQALIDQGFSDAEIEKAMGGNVIRVLKATLPR